MDNQLECLRMTVKAKILTASEEFLNRLQAVDSANYIGLHADLRHILGRSQALQSVMLEIQQLQRSANNG